MYAEHVGTESDATCGLPEKGQAPNITSDDDDGDCARLRVFVRASFVRPSLIKMTGACDCQRNCLNMFPVRNVDLNSSFVFRCRLQRIHTILRVRRKRTRFHFVEKMCRTAHDATLASN